MRKLGRRSLWLVAAWFALTVTAWCGAGFTVHSPQVYEIKQQVRLKRSGGAIENLKLQIPMFLLENSPPYQRMIAFRSDISQLRYFASKTAPRMEYTLNRWADNRDIQIELCFTIENQAIEYELPKYTGRNSVEISYLKPEGGIESTAVEIVDFATRLTNREKCPLDKACKLFYYVNSKLKYKLNDDTDHSALRTLKRGYGNCEDFSLLYIALCRSIGIPARFVNGYRFEPAQVQFSEVDLTPFGHAWVEINLPGIGWMPVEPTFTYTVNGEKKVDYDFFGRIKEEDRHLVSSYARGEKMKCTWKYDMRVKAEVEMSTRMTIRRLK